MSRNLNDGQRATLSQAIRGVVDAADKLREAPRFSTRADNFTDQILRASEVGKKLLSELGESPTPDTPANLPDSGRGDFDTKGERGTVPKGLTSTHSMANNPADWREGGAKEQTNVNEDGSQTFGGKDPKQAATVVPGLSGHPVKKDDRERAGNEFTVSSSTHVAAARGEHTNADTLEGGRQAIEQGGGSAQRDTEPGSDDNPANISEPFKQGLDTTNTSSEGSGKPDNYFAVNGGDANEPKKYDSENRVATETLGHIEAKKRMQEENPGYDGGTSSNPDDEFNSENPSATEKSAADRKQETRQGDNAAKANTNKPQTPAADNS